LQTKLATRSLTYTERFSIREIIDMIGDRLSGTDEEEDEEERARATSESEESIDLESEIRNLRDRSAAMEESYELHGDLD
jgi:hypothetical protein